MDSNLLSQAIILELDSGQIKGGLEFELCQKFATNRFTKVAQCFSPYGQENEVFL